MKFTSEEAVSFRSYKAIPTPLSSFTARSDARAMSGEEPALSRPHEQNGQMKSERSRGVITGNPSRARAHVAKSSMAQIPRLRLNGRQHSRRATDNSSLPKNLMAIRRFMKAYAILWQKLCAGFRNTLSINANESWDAAERPTSMFVIVFR
jgi:hypothetical protein